MTDLFLSVLRWGSLCLSELCHSSEGRCHPLPMPPACLQPGFLWLPKEVVTSPLLALGNEPKTTGVARGHRTSGFLTDPAASAGAIAALLHEGDPFLGLVCTPANQVL